jgi:signal transduction histidine kinase
MAAHKSLRRRAAIAIALFTIVVVGAHSIAVFSVTDEQEEDFIDQMVSEELEYLATEYARNPAITPPASQHLTGYIARNPTQRAALPAYLHKLDAGLHEFLIEKGEVHVGVRRDADTWFYVVYDAVPHEERMSEFGWLLVFSVFASALVAAALGYWVAGLVVQPVTRLAQRVGELGVDRRHRAIADEFAEAEVARLARAFDAYVERVAQLIEREREFTDNVSHELRTPLTSIQTGCELLLNDPALPAETRRRIESIGRAAVRMTDMARLFLVLARENRPQESETFALHECFVEAAEPLRSLADDKGLAFEIDVPRDAVLHTDRHALSLMTSNLLRNAIANTERGAVRLRYRDGALIVEDSGRGIAEADLSRVFERFYRADAARHDGSGLGLSIVKRLCDRYGWRIELDSTLGVGTRVRIAFPTSQELNGSLTKT